MNKIILVYRPTRLDSLVAKFNTKQQAKFYIEHLGASFEDYQNEHDNYYKQLNLLSDIAARYGKVQLVDWKFLPNFLFGKNDLVLTIGQDGLVANTLKYLDSQNLIGFNSDSSRWDGKLSKFSVGHADEIIQNTLNGKSHIQKVTKAKVTLSDNQVLYAVNDFFIGVNNHSSARYEISFNGKTENQSSSGIIVSTPLGRSGWMTSVLAGASGITNCIARKKSVITPKQEVSWDADSLVFAVREPFPSVNTGSQLVFGSIKKDNSFSIESKMGENGIIFSDGIQSDYLDFNYSVVADITIAESKGNVVVTG